MDGVISDLTFYYEVSVTFYNVLETSKIFLYSNTNRIKTKTCKEILG